ncbi:cellulase family glycosylhydrolase [Dactylosporangium sp. CA-152071]|uniref:cellulase family glycosylhydrolase n=1 Tax=Dactylosporangium sp. CA-152071 TaxID=3239933 RepID=UPI003D8A8581
MTGFLHRQRQTIVDGNGDPVRLRGAGLGNWWLPEGYMWRFGDAAASPRAIERVIADLVGPDAADRFWRRYREEYVTEADVAAMAAEGWNSVRLPLNARYLMGEDGQFNEDAFALVDRFLGWCRTHAIWVVVDLHGAPGGQTGTNIDDSPNNYPELFTTAAHQDATVRLWRELARRYRDETIVAGYDLLNEPLPRDFQYKYPNELVALYRRLIAEIRTIDPDHMIILEGSNWARNWSIFDELWDDNLLLQFHKYWDSPDRDQLREYLAKREELDVPIYMGEGGENNNGWYAAAFQLLEDLDISWNFWTWKKLAKRNSPATVREPAGWQSIVDYVFGGPRPDAGAAGRTLEEFLDNLALERCDYRHDVVNAVMRRAPLRWPAEYFGHLGQGNSYGVGTPGQPMPGFRESDLVTVRYRAEVAAEAGYAPAGPDEPNTFVPGATPATAGPNFRHNLGQERASGEAMVVCLADGDWLSYEVNTVAAGALLVTVRTGPGGTGHVEPAVDGAQLRPVAPAPGAEPDPGTGQRDTRFVTAAEVPAGRHTIIVRAAGGLVVLDHLDIAPAGGERSQA